MPTIATLQTVFLSLWNSRYSYFLETGLTECIVSTECLKSYSFGKEIFKALCSVVNKYNDMTLLKVISLRQFKVLQLV